MESASRIKQYSSREAYLNKNPLKMGKDPVSEGLSKTIGNNSSATPDATKVDLSKESLKKNDIKKKLSDKVKDVKETIKEDAKSLGKASTHLAGDALSTIGNAAAKLIPKVPFMPSIPSVEINSEETKEIKKSEPTKEDKPSIINKPAIFFVSGLNLVLSSGEDGLKEMSEAVRGAEHFSWDQEDEAFEAILKRPKEQPVILIGHSLGGDSVVNLSNRLNTLEGGFRKVSLLATLDSVGFDNDIIPTNVEKNLNFISDDDYFFNDGPNIARNTKKSEVINFLRTDTHREIDNENEVQSEIISHIDEVMGEFKHKRQLSRLKDLYSSIK